MGCSSRLPSNADQRFVIFSKTIESTREGVAQAAVEHVVAVLENVLALSNTPSHAHVMDMTAKECLGLLHSPT